MPDAPNNRERSQVKEPSKCLNDRSYRERLGKEAKTVKLSLSADDMRLYLENPKDGIRKLLELIYQSCRVQNQYTEITCISIY